LPATLPAVLLRDASPATTEQLLSQLCSWQSSVCVCWERLCFGKFGLF